MTCKKFIVLNVDDTSSVKYLEMCEVFVRNRGSGEPFLMENTRRVHIKRSGS